MADFTKSMADISIPEELDLVIERAIKQGGNDMKKIKIKRVMTSIAGVVAGIMLVFTSTVNISSAFADSIASFPIISDLAEAVTITRSSEKMIQNLKQTSSDKGITIAVKPVLIDGKRCTIPVKVSVGEEYENVQSMLFSDLKVTDLKGKDLITNNSSGSFSVMVDTHNDFVKTDFGKEMNFNINLLWSSESSDMPKDIVITANKMRAIYNASDKPHNTSEEYIKGKWQVKVSEIQPLIGQEVYQYKPIEKVIIANNDFNITSIKSYATVTEVSIKEGEAFYTAFRDYNYRLQDENENTYINIEGSLHNGVAILSFKSVYDNMPNELYMRLISKDKYKEDTVVRIGKIN